MKKYPDLSEVEQVPETYEGTCIGCVYDSNTGECVCPLAWTTITCPCYPDKIYKLKHNETEISSTEEQ